MRISLKAIQTFHVAAENLSFKHAAAKLHVTPSAVSHQIKRLEQELGVPVFRRLPRGLELTKEGEEYISYVRQAFQLLDQGHAAVQHRDEVEVLRVSALPFFASTYLIPNLKSFHEAHPNIELNIETTSQYADFSKDSVDLGIRYAEHPPQGLSCTKLVDVKPIPLCAPALTKGKGALKKPGDLASHTLIHLSIRPTTWPDWLKSVGEQDLKPKNELHVDTIPASLQAAKAGMGVMIGPAPIIWHGNNMDGLVAPFDMVVDGVATYYLVHRPEDGAKPKIKSFKKWLLQIVRNASTNSDHSSDSQAKQHAYTDGSGENAHET